VALEPVPSLSPLVVLAHDDPGTADSLRHAVQSATGWQVVMADPSPAGLTAALATGPSVALVGCAALASLPADCRTPIVAIGDDDRAADVRAALAAGARSLLAWPDGVADLPGELARVALVGQPGSAAGHVGLVIATRGAQGGAGTTTVAIHLAAAWARWGPTPVLLLDLAGGLAFRLDLGPVPTWSTLTPVAGSAVPAAGGVRGSAPGPASGSAVGAVDSFGRAVPEALVSAVDPVQGSALAPPSSAVDPVQGFALAPPASAVDPFPGSVPEPPATAVDPFESAASEPFVSVTDRVQGSAPEPPVSVADPTQGLAVEHAVGTAAATSGGLDAATLVGTLAEPWTGLSVLPLAGLADGVPEPPPELWVVQHVLEVARTAYRVVVVDLPATDGPAVEVALSRADALVAVGRCETAGVRGLQAAIETWTASGHDLDTAGAVVTGVRPQAPLAPREVRAALGGRLWGLIPTAAAELAAAAEDGILLIDRHDLPAVQAMVTLANRVVPFAAVST
jgi:MinD-like ATPase involved in chromosome partitioning or flagellar assembly